MFTFINFVYGKLERALSRTVIGRVFLVFVHLLFAALCVFIAYARFVDH